MIIWLLLLVFIILLLRDKDCFLFCKLVIFLLFNSFLVLICGIGLGKLKLGLKFLKLLFFGLILIKLFCLLIILLLLLFIIFLNKELLKVKFLGERFLILIFCKRVIFLVKREIIVLLFFCFNWILLIFMGIRKLVKLIEFLLMLKFIIIFIEFLLNILL